MGIKELWPFLNPYCVRKPLYELQGKTVAIDLAGWICESLCVVDYEVQARFYLRNLFFRTCYLLLSGITPVFVLEGTAPVLKHQMISKRNQIQFRGAKPRKEKTPATQDQSQTQSAATQANTQKASKGRTRFNYVLKQCEELIRSMGLQCVQGPGEAEAFCAHLNAHGLVDGVISQDSDCFAYGARRVFRNFSLSMQGTAGSIGGSIDIYDLDFVQKSVDFGRNKIIVMALLCGCDYCPEGVGGVGRDAVYKLFNIYSEKDILERVRMWRKNDNKFTELEMKVDDKSLCVNCGHYGRIQSHTKSGCAQCRMTIGCDSSLWKEKRLALKSELQIRKKAMQIDDFPSEEIIDEFMQDPIDMPPLQLDWGQPNVVKFVKMMGKLIQWDEIYCFQKFLPLLTRWQLHHADDDNSNVILRGCVQPDFIKKKRAPKGVPSYEIIWKDEEGCFRTLIPDDQLRMFYSTNKEKSETEALQILWSTIEPIDLVQKAYPELVSQFEESKAKSKAKKTKKSQDPTTKVTKGRTVKNVNACDEPEVSEKPRKKVTSRAGAKSKKKNDENARPIDMFFRKQQAIPPVTVYSSPKIKTTTKPMNLSAFSLDFNDSLMSPEQDDMNLSAIINEMITRPPNVTEFNGKKLKFDAIMPSINSPNDDVNRKYEEMEEIKQKNDIVEAKTAITEESMDEFDLIVMRKMRKSLIGRRNSILTSNTNDVHLTNCSTPVSSNRGSRLNASLKQSPDLSFMFETSTNRKNTVISSSFFAVNQEDEVDLFEKSIDFRNMQDVSSSDEESDSPHNSDSPAHESSTTSTLSNQLNEYDVDQNDTFDRLVGVV